MSDLHSGSSGTDWVTVKTPLWATTQLVGALVGLVAFVWVTQWAPVLEVAVCLAGAGAALKFIHPEKVRIDPPDLEFKRWRAPRRFAATEITSLQVQTYRVTQPILFVGTSREDIGPIPFIPDNRPAVARLLALLEDPELGSRLPKESFSLMRRFVSERSSAEGGLSS